MRQNEAERDPNAPSKDNKALIREVMLKTRSNTDGYSLVPDTRSKNPFMTKIMKSADFRPVQGVTHYDKANDKNSPNISGGEW